MPRCGEILLASEELELENLLLNLLLDGVCGGSAASTKVSRKVVHVKEGGVERRRRVLLCCACQSRAKEKI